jgi:hypothetical protein
LLNVLLQIANKFGLSNKKKLSSSVLKIFPEERTGGSTLEENIFKGISLISV